MAKCRQCNAEVRWERENGRWFCKNADGSDHWDLCSKRRWHRIATEGEHFDHGNAKGYTHDELGTKYYMKSAGARAGSHYKPSGKCRACVPPWETCPEKCPDEFGLT